MSNGKAAVNKLLWQSPNMVLLRGALMAYKAGKRLTVAQAREVKALLDREVHSGAYSKEEVELAHDLYAVAKAIYKRVAKVVP